MKTPKAITVFFEDGKYFEIDIKKQCALFWGDKGWDTLEQFYLGKGEKKKAQEVRDRKCPKAKSQGPKGDDAMMRTADSDTDPIVALKDPNCDPTQYP